jgi:GntR family transcriptional regulator/MocR family aminotransferase
MARATTTSVDEASWLGLDAAPGETLRAALERTLRDAIREGALRPGARLPSSRRLAAEVGVSRGVASDAYAQLEAQGFVVMAARRAPSVATVAPSVAHRPRSDDGPARPWHFDLTPTTPDVTLFPMRQWLAALRHAARGAPARALDYGDPRGDAGLRETLADHLGRTRGVVADPEQIIVVQGTAQGLDLVLRLLRDRGARRVAVEDPSLSGQQRRIEALDLEVVGRAVDDQGIVVGDLEADAIVVTPSHQFPTGVVLSGERRRALLSWARERRGLVVEDDYDAEFRYDREPVRALQGLDPDRVAYLGTVSKTLAPALRLGWLVAPQELAEEAAQTKSFLDFCSPVLEQLALRHLIDAGEYDRHVRRVRAIYRARRDRLVAALAEQLPELRVEGVAAGLHVLVRLPPGVDDERVATDAAREGIYVEPLSRFAVGGGASSGLVVGYGRVHETALEPAVVALAAVVRRTEPSDSVNVRASSAGGCRAASELPDPPGRP